MRIIIIIIISYNKSEELKSVATKQSHSINHIRSRPLLRGENVLIGGTWHRCLSTNKSVANNSEWHRWLSGTLDLFRVYSSLSHVHTLDPVSFVVNWWGVWDICPSLKTPLAMWCVSFLSRLSGRALVEGYLSVKTSLYVVCIYLYVDSVSFRSSKDIQGRR